MASLEGLATLSSEVGRRRAPEMVIIRAEQPGDVSAVRRVNEAAFAGPVEAGIVDAIRAACPDAVSLVAVDDGGVEGHIFFSPACISGKNGPVQGMGLGPMAVNPEKQREGIGSELVEAGLAVIRECGCPFLVVLGHPGYYPRFGFRPASLYGLKCQWDGVPDEAFMALVLDERAMHGVTGTVTYRREFDEAVD